MNKMIPRLKHITIPAVLLFSFCTGNGQITKPGNNKVIPVQKFIPPKVKTAWGNNTDSVSISIEEALQLLSIPIRISDEKKKLYALSSYQFLYRKLGVTEDEISGRTSPSSTVVADFFRSTPLPDIWVKSISTQLKKGEEFYFFDVVAKDNQGHFFFAPTLKVRIN